MSNCWAVGEAHELQSCALLTSQQLPMTEDQWLWFQDQCVFSVPHTLLLLLPVTHFCCCCVSHNRHPEGPVCALPAAVCAFPAGSRRVCVTLCCLSHFCCCVSHNSPTPGTSLCPSCCLRMSQQTLRITTSSTVTPWRRLQVMGGWVGGWSVG